MSETVDWQPLADLASERALDLIRSRYEGGRHPQHMHYHNRVHTAGVIEKARRIGEALGMNTRELMVTTIAAAFHDTVQDWAPSPREDGIVVRLRFVGANEIASAKEAMEWIAGSGADLSGDEKGLIGAAILATVPRWSADYQTVIQPLLMPNSPKVVRAVALADLASSGMDTPMFLTDGPYLFAEENLDVMEALETAQVAADIDGARQRSFAGRYLGWLGIQPDFARGRERYLAEAGLGGPDERAEARLDALFSSYDASVAAAEDALARAQQLAFVPLMRQLSPAAFPGEA